MSDTDKFPLLKGGEARTDHEIELEMRMCVILAIALILLMGGFVIAKVCL